MSLISCQKASFAYDGKIVVSDLNFEVNTGDYLCILGENGSGKSTLIKGILGLILPTRGTIGFGDGLIQNEIGYLPQQTMVQRDFPASVYEVVISGCLNRIGNKPFYSKAEKELAYTNMKKLNIFDLRKHCYRELSGGQQQRVLLARAICATRKLVILDEPVSGLDAVATADLYHLIEKLNHEDGITVIMVSHDVELATKNASHILHLKHTQLFFGSKSDYLSSEAKKIFFGGEDFGNH